VSYRPHPDGVFDYEMNVYMTGTGQLLSGIHPLEACGERDYCVIHRPSPHAMRGMRTHFRDDRGFMERICAHGVGHPDPDDPFADPVHGCDGCCGGHIPVPG
jgi:hypothetical protein